MHTPVAVPTSPEASIPSLTDDQIRSAFLPDSYVHPNKRPELFLIPLETIRAISMEEVAATYKDMVSLNIGYLPYPVMDIAVPAAAILRMYDDPTANEAAFKNWTVRVRYDNGQCSAMVSNSSNIFFDMSILLDYYRNNNDVPPQQYTPTLASQLQRILVVLLATKNVIKTRTKDKLLAMNIGARKNSFRPLYTTTVSAPPPAETTDHPDNTPGSPKRPHLRRGHIRHQPYGPKRSFNRTIWIEPMFINCDENYISSRTAYNLSIGTTAPTNGSPTQ